MRFDDRLSTVLGLSAEAPRDRAVQWRQLVELVARGGGESDPALLAKAIERIAELRPELPDAVRASAARAVAGLAVPVGLLAVFAADRPEVVAPLLAGASLGPDQWSEIRRKASPDVRALIDAISPPPAAEPTRPPAAPQLVPRRAAPAAGAVSAFRWECGPRGDIDWVEGVPRAAVVGLSLAREIRQPFVAHLPFQDELLVTSHAGAVAGPWLWSGSPRFEQETGRFAGYTGVARREGTTHAPVGRATEGPPPPTAPDSDSLRELIHELRTPLTAIIGFGEIIEGQFLGPAHRAYRSRAGEIVRQARRLLGAVEELDLAAKLEAGGGGTGTGAPVAPLMRDLEARLSAALKPDGASLRVEVRSGSGRYAMDRTLAERLIGRFAEAVLDAAAPGEQIDMVVDHIGSQIAVALDRPRLVAGLSEDQLFDPALDVAPGTDLGLGFALRLLRGLAAIAGGGLDISPDRIVLLLPASQAAA